ncbi:MAG: hypothetical protein R3E09_18375 [Novosphingobium sp.]|nr:hypothetical protein [Novosphingobium sp.]
MALLLAFFIFMRGDGRSTVFAELPRDPLSLLAERSPGQRPAGALFNVKPPKVTFRQEEPIVPAPVYGPDILPKITQELLSEPPIGPDTPELPYTPTICCELTVNEPPLTPPLTPILPFLPPPVRPLPEPETWITMLLGIFAIGSAMRRTKVRESKASSRNAVPDIA